MIKKGYLLLLTGLLFLLGSFTISCTSDLEQQEIISFTQQVLEIEAKRSDLTAFFAGGSDLTAFLASEQRAVIKWLTELYFFGGVPTTALLKDAPPSDLEGMVSLQNKLLLLECPQSIQHIKDSLVYIYNSEISLAELEFQMEEENSNLVPFFGTRFVLPEVNQYNLELWKEKYESWQMPGVSQFMNHPWVKLQLLRRDVYTRWAEILREHGIDPAQEGFTELSELE